MTNPQELEFTTVKGCARMLDVSEHKVLKLVHSKRLDAANVSSGERPRWRIPLASIARFASTKD